MTHYFVLAMVLFPCVCLCGWGGGGLVFSLQKRELLPWPVLGAERQ